MTDAEGPQNLGAQTGLETPDSALPIPGTSGTDLLYGLAVSLRLGLGVTFVPGILRSLPELLRHALSSGIATGGMCALILNALLPGERC